MHLCKLGKILVIFVLVCVRTALAAVSDTDSILEKADARVQAMRLDKLKDFNSKRVQSEDVPSTFDPTTEVADLLKLSLADVHKLATRHNRDFANARDQNTSVALSYIQARHLFDPKLSGTVSLLSSWSDQNANGEDKTLIASASAGLGLDYLTEVGTRLHVDLNANHTRDVSGHAPSSANTGSSVIAGNTITSTGPNSSSRAAQLAIDQPLLRGAGKTVVREPLTQAERNIVYRLRAFDLFRQDFCIDATSRYYNLFREKQVISNNKQRFEQADFLYRRSKALYKIGRARELDVLQSEQERLQAENSLRDAEETHKDSLLSFKTFLGISDEVSIEIEAAEPAEFEHISMDANDAVKIALENRLDLITQHEQMEDARRGVKIAHNGLLPDLNLEVKGGTAAQSPRFTGQAFNNHNASAGLTLSLPFDRLNEKVALKQSELLLDGATRALAQFRDTLSADVRKQLRNLTRIEQSMAIQKKIVIAASKRLINAQILFKQGQRTSRDVVEAQQDLLNARNDDVQFIVDHVIAELQFRRALGVLAIQPDGLPVQVDLNPAKPMGNP